MKKACCIEMSLKNGVCNSTTKKLGVWLREYQIELKWKLIARIHQIKLIR